MFEHSLLTREHVKQAYLHSGNTQKQIADEFYISERTLRYWIKKFCWYDQKHRMQHPPASISEAITMQLTSLQNKIIASDSGVPSMEEAHVMQKLLYCLKKLNDEPALNTLSNTPPCEIEDDEEEVKIISEAQPAISPSQTAQSIDDTAFFENSARQ